MEKVKKTAQEVIKEVCQKVTSQVIDLMKREDLKWTSGVMRSARPVNGFSESFYNGINWVYLSTKTQFTSPVWFTFEQAKSLGYELREGERACHVFFYSMIFFDKKTKKKISQKVVDAMTEEEKSKLDKAPYLKYANVFNLDQFDNVGDDDNRRLLNARKLYVCDQVVSSWKDCPALIVNNESKRGYKLEDHTITLPHKWQYESIARYYKVLFHEMVHATGKVLKRRSMLDYENQQAYEELVAELGAAFLCNYTGIDVEENTNSAAAYIKHWITAMENDERYLFRAAGDAQKAVNEILKDYPLQQDNHN